MPLPLRYPTPLGDPQIRSLMRRYRKHGDEDALKRVIESNIGLAKKIAHQYHAPGVHFDDLFSEAMIGLILGCRRYDPERGTRITTYVAWWIRAYLSKFCMAQGGPVTFGKTTGDREVYHAVRKEARLTSGRVDVSNLAHRLGVTPEFVGRVLERISARDWSLERPMHGGDDGANLTLGDTLADSAPGPEAEAAEHEGKAQAARRVRRALRVLSEREQLVIRRRLLVEDPETLSDIGKKLGLTRERVRQIEKRAKQKLKAALAA